MNGRAWGGGAAALLLCAAFAHYCVRIVPADAPQRASAPPEPRAAPPRADRPVATGALLIPVEGIPPSALVDTFTQARAGGARPRPAGRRTS